MVMAFNESQIDKIAGKEFRRISVCKKKSKTMQISEWFLGEYKLTAEWNKEVNKSIFSFLTASQVVFNREAASVAVLECE